MPISKTKGGKKIHINNFWQHPFFELFRKYKIKITLSSDNPGIAGIPVKETILILAGLNNKYKAPKEFIPLQAEELAILCLNGIHAIFAQKQIQQEYKKLLFKWIEEHNLNYELIQNYYKI